MISTFRTQVRDFRKKEDGAVAMIFGLTVIVMFFCVGMALDIGRGYHASNKTAEALDAAVLAAAREMQKDSSLSDMQLGQIAQNFFDANIAGAGITQTTINPLNLTVDRTNSTITGDVTGTVKTIFADVAGMGLSTLNVGKTSTATYNLRDIELAMALDVTGSMCTPCSKIDALKDAAKDLVDILMPDSGTPGRKVRIGLAPYAASVRPSLAMAKAVTNNATVDGCVIEREGSAAYDDAYPGPGDYLNAKTSSSPPNSHYSCVGSSLLEMQTQSAKSVLKTKIDGLTTGGWTAGHLGAAWAWYMISPEWNAAWGLAEPIAPYNDPKTIKAIILMTDGEFNTSYKNGAQNATSTDQALALCSSMKHIDHNVVVYAVAFQAPPAAKATLQSCASSPNSPHFFEANNAAELRDAFKNIAVNLNNLRLTN